jgi:hypothetical protein
MPRLYGLLFLFFATIQLFANAPTSLCVTVEKLVVLQPNCYKAGYISIDVNEQPGPVSYTWSTGDTGQTISQLSNGIYMLTVSQNGCNDVFTFELSGGPATLTDPGQYGVEGGAPPATYNYVCGLNGLLPNAINATAANCSDGALATYQWFKSINEENFANAEPITGADEEDYQPQLQVAPGQEVRFWRRAYCNCQAPEEGSVIEPPMTVAVSYPAFDIEQAPQSACPDDDITLSVVNLSGSLPYGEPVVYEWSAAPNHQGNSLTLPASQWPQGPVTITVTDQAGCSRPVDFELDRAEAINFSSVVDEVSCPGEGDGSIELNPTPYSSAYTYLWSDGATTEDRNNIGPGNYSVTLTTPQGCIESASFLLASPPEISLNPYVTAPSCFEENNGSVDLNPGNVEDWSYDWSDGSAESFYRNDLSADNYTVTVTDETGCSQTVTFSVPDGPEFIVSAALEHNICGGSSDGLITLTVPTGFGTLSYLWSDGATTKDRADLPAGTYTVTVSSPSSCQTIINSVINDENLPLTVSCNVLSVPFPGQNSGSIAFDISGGTAPYYYTINGSAGTSTNSASVQVDQLSTGNQTITVTDANDCTYSCSLQLQEESCPTSFVEIVNGLDYRGSDSCDPVSGFIEIMTGGNTEYTFVLNGNLPPTTGTRWNNLPVGDYIITASNGGCTVQSGSIGIVDLTQNVFEDIHITQLTDCGVADGILQIETAIAGNFLYSIDGGITYQTGPNFTQLGAGEYLPKIRDPATNCVWVWDEPVIIIQANVPAYSSIQVQSSSNCTDDDGAITVLNPVNSFEYSFNGGASWGMNNAQAGLSSGSYTIIIRSVDHPSCLTTENIQVEVLAPLSLIIDEEVSPLCYQESTGLIFTDASGGDGNYSYDWSNGMSGPEISGLAAGGYTVTVTDGRDCQEVLSLSLAEREIYIELDTLITDRFPCGDEVVQFDLTFTGEEFTFSWVSPSGQETNSPLLTADEAGEYQFTATSTNGCILSDTFSVSLIQQSDIQADFLLPADGVINNATVAIDVSQPRPTSIEWFYDNDVANQIRTEEARLWLDFLEPGEHEITLVANYGECSAEVTRTIYVYESVEDLDRLVSYTSGSDILQAELFPNPHNGLFTVNVSLAEEMNATLFLYDENGSLVNSRILAGIDVINEAYDLPELGAGVHTLVIKTPNSIHYIRHIKY